MKTLGASHLKLLPCQGVQKERASLGSREIACLGYQKRVRNGDGFPVQAMYAPSISAVSSSSSSSSQIKEIQSVNASKSVHIEFRLKKKCEFGQRFTLVGDVPALGLWNPVDGVPLHWYDDHVWTAEIDAPSGKMIKYKFILMCGAETISWQPGPDRFVETSNRHTKLVVSEDWDDPLLQNILEKHPETDLNMEKGSDLEEASNTNCAASLIPSSPVFAAALLVGLSYEVEKTRNDSREEEVPDNGAPIRAPELVAAPQGQIVEPFASENTSSGLDEPLETHDGDEEQQFRLTEQLEVLQKDLQWCRKSLHKFLASLRFQ